MKIIIKNIARSIGFGAWLLLICCAFRMLFSFFKLKIFLFGILVSCVPLALAWLCFHFASMRTAITSIDDLNKEYKDVKHFTRFHIIFLLAFEIALFVITISLNFYNTVDYATNYPDAEEFLVDEMEVGKKTIAVVKAFPTWAVEELWVISQSIHDAAEYDDTLCDEVVAIANKMNAKIQSLHTKRWLSLLITFLFGVTYTYSKRSYQYIHLKNILKQKGA